MRLTELITEPLLIALEKLSQFAPRFFGLVFILLVGWGLALLIRKVAYKSLLALKVDHLTEKAGLKKFFEKGKLEGTLSDILASLAYWVSIALVVYVALNAAGLAISVDVVEKLKSVEIVETGLPLFQVIGHGNEVIVKFNLKRSVDLYRNTDLESLRVRAGDKEVAFLDVARRHDRRRSAMHSQEAVLILNGPGIRQGEWIEGAEIIDLAPTLLEAISYKPEAGISFDGRVLDVFETPRSATASAAA